LRLVSAIGRVPLAGLYPGRAWWQKPSLRQPHSAFMVPAAQAGLAGSVSHLGRIIGQRQAP
jgi:hypothetical protein